MASSSSEVFVSGVDDEKIMEYFEQCDVNADELTSESESDFSSDSSEDIIPDTPPGSPYAKKRRIFVSNRPDHKTTTNCNPVNAVESEDDSCSDDNNGNDEFSEILPNNDHPPHPPFSFMELPGPKHAPPPDSSPISYFHLFFTNTLLSLIVTETNRYADQFLGANELSPSARSRSWRRTTVVEIKAFIAVIMNMGLIRKPTIVSYWNTTDHLSTPWFGKMFSRNRFQLLLKFFHLVDNSKLSPPGSPDYDPCSRFLPLLDHANRMFRYHYTPHQKLSIDESLVGTKCHTQLLQYLPNKHHHRWGIKFWMLCDSVTKYCLCFFTYRGAKSNEDKNAIKKHGLAYTVVTKLLSLGNYFMKGYHVYTDNFFTSIPLAKHLYSLGTFITGTVRRNRKGLPGILKQQFKSVTNKYFRQGPLLLLGSKQKKSHKNQVVLLSTNGTATESNVIPNARNRNEPKKKPDVILDYNLHMGGDRRK